jgi:hypothetical protein
MNYESSQPFNGNPAKAIDFAAMTLAAIGFRIDERTDSTLRASGYFTSTNKNAWFGVSQVILRVSGGLVSAQAQLDGPK